MVRSITWKSVGARYYPILFDLHLEGHSMLKSVGRAPSSEIESIVQDLLREDSDYDRHENRSAHREHLVRSVVIDVRRPDPIQVTGFSRNISGSGIGLITQLEILPGSVAVLTIEPLRGMTHRILSECKWCKKYGSRWFISGWQFMAATT